MRVMRLAGATGLAVSASAVFGQIANPGFETGDFTGWTIVNQSIYCSISGTAHTGSHSLQMGALTASPADEVNQVLSIPAGTYTVSFWAEQLGGAAGSADNWITLDGHDVYHGQVPNSWTHYTATLTVNANPVLDVTGWNTPSFNYYDDFTIAPAASACYANCDNSTNPPILNANDFQCFLNKYAAGDSTANCDNSTNPPILNANDFQCFLNAYAAGCGS